MSKYLISFILIMYALTFAGTEVVCRAPQNIQLAKVYNGAQLTWEYSIPDLAISLFIIFIYK